MDEYFKKYNDLFERFEKETGLKFKNEDNRTDTITDDYVEWLENQVKKLSLANEACGSATITDELTMEYRTFFK